MIRILVFLIIVFAVAFGFVWLADHPGTVSLTWPWANTAVEVSLMVAAIGVVVALVVLMLLVSIVAAIVNSPRAFSRWRQGRKRDRGYQALSRGLVAAGAGNALIAHRMAKDARRYLPNEPLTEMLDAQTALLEGRHDTARERFEKLAANEETRLLGLRGLYLEAERLGERDAAAFYAQEAVKAEPGTGWAVQTLLRDQAMHGEWRDALATLENNRGTGLFEREEFDRKKAVVLTAMARDEADAQPEKARDHALAAHKLAPDLVPAALLYARASVRLGDLKRAAKVLEATWERQPHPDIADAYVNLRPGDAVGDRLIRARKLAERRGMHEETRIMLARAALDADEFDTAREELKPLLENRPSERVCLLMADIEEAQHGDRGRVRDWLARALRAPRDPAWVADGVVSERWQPVSPVTGELDAFEWKAPAENTRALAGPDGRGGDLEHGELPHLSPALRTSEERDDVEDAEVVDAKELPLAPVPASVKARPKQVQVPKPVAPAAAAAQKNEKADTPQPADASVSGTVALAKIEGEPAVVKPAADAKVVEVQPAARSGEEPKLAVAATEAKDAEAAEAKPDTGGNGSRKDAAGTGRPATTPPEQHQPDDPGVERSAR